MSHSGKMSVKIFQTKNM